MNAKAVRYSVSLKGSQYEPIPRRASGLV
jgi:hypothetical protein